MVMTNRMCAQTSASCDALGDLNLSDASPGPAPASLRASATSLDDGCWVKGLGFSPPPHEHVCAAPSESMKGRFRPRSCTTKDVGPFRFMSMKSGSMSWSFGSSRASRSRALARMSVALAPGLGRHGASLCDACDIPTHAADGYAWGRARAGEKSQREKLMLKVRSLGRADALHGAMRTVRKKGLQVAAGGTVKKTAKATTAVDGEDGTLATTTTTTTTTTRTSKRRSPVVGPCVHGGNPRSKCVKCSGCEHGRWRKFCKACGGGAFCEHDVVKYSCTKCVGGSVCEHGRRRTRCVDCGGGSICPHKRQRNTCKDCGGASVCPHKKLRHRCAECGGRSVCPHSRLRYRCKDCMGDAAAKW